jgi:hypothetical protein
MPQRSWIFGLALLAAAGAAPLRQSATPADVALELVTDRQTPASPDDHRKSEPAASKATGGSRATAAVAKRRERRSAHRSLTRFPCVRRVEGIAARAG